VQRSRGTNLLVAIGSDDPALEHMLSLQAVAAHWDELPRREQRITTTAA
jgi:hypothetical protein